MKSQNQASILHLLKKEMPYLRQNFGIEHLALYGSFARNTAGENSDIDLVVYLTKPLGFAFIELADYLEKKLGRKVDLITSTTLETGIMEPGHEHIARNIRESLIYV